MMERLGTLVYRLMVRIHPEAFRNQFGSEMLLDFNEALHTQGKRALYADALISLARQWVCFGASGAYESPSETGLSLLKGQYVMIRSQRLTGLEWSRGLLASSVLICLCIYSLGSGRVSGHSRLGYSAMQVVMAAQTQPSRTGFATPPDQPRAIFTEFDVVSVRENKTGTTHTSFAMGMGDIYLPTHGYMQMIGLPLVAYIQFAYNMNANDIVALSHQLPDWALSARYDIEARVDGEPTKADMRRMVRALLADRFKLKLHTETRIDNVYDLVLSKRGKMGPSLHEHSSDSACNQQQRTVSAPCGTIAQRTLAPGKQQMIGSGVPLADFIFAASPKSDRTIIDRTGLMGRYDFTLQFAPQRIGSGLETNPSEPPPGPTFAEALHDQMGLKLVPDKGPVMTYVLDHVEKPTEN